MANFPREIKGNDFDSTASTALCLGGYRNRHIEFYFLKSVHEIIGPIPRRANHARASNLCFPLFLGCFDASHYLKH